MMLSSLRFLARCAALACCLITACMGPTRDGPLSFTAEWRTLAAPGSLAQQDLPAGLRGRHQIHIQAGLLDWSVDSSISAGGGGTEASSSGFSGAIGYDYFVEEELAVGVALGVLDAESSMTVDAGGVTSRSATVVHLLAGVRYYPEAVAIGSTVRPYVSGAAGPYIGSATNSQVGSTLAAESITEAVLGLRLAGGLDWFPSRNFKLGFGLGYHLMSDFDERIGSTDNYSGPEVTFSLGVLFGGGS